MQRSGMIGRSARRDMLQFRPALTGRSVRAFYRRNAPERNGDDRQDIPALRSRGPHLRSLGRGGRVPGRPARACRRRAVLHRHPAAERHRLAAYGPCAQQHAAGRAVPLRAHARQGRALAAGHRPCRHRHPDGGRAPADGAPGARPARRSAARSSSRRSGQWKARVRRHHHQPAQAPRRLLRLVARALHHGRGAVARGPQGVRRALPRRA